MHTDQFRALVLEQDGPQVVPRLRKLSLAELPDGDVLVQVHHSSLSFKDSMVLANKGSPLHFARYQRAWYRFRALRDTKKTAHLATDRTGLAA